MITVVVHSTISEFPSVLFQSKEFFYGTIILLSASRK